MATYELPPDFNSGTPLDLANMERSRRRQGRRLRRRSKSRINRQICYAIAIIILLITLAFGGETTTSVLTGNAEVASMLASDLYHPNH